MANPNILDVSSITGKTNVFQVSSSITSVLTNLNGSNKVYKINTLFISNINGSANVAITVDFYRDSVGYKIASTIDVAADTTLVVLGKDTGIYLEPGDSLRCLASLDNYLTGILSYEILE